MSKIRLTPNASGTGTVTLTVPSTSTDRTITLPDTTGTLLDSSGQYVDFWYLNANQSNGTITSGWVRAADTQPTDSRTGVWGSLGTAMSESSGVFTFPKTGIWRIQFEANIVNTAGSGYDTTYPYIQSTENNTDFGTMSLILRGSQPAGQSNNSACSVLFDCKDTSNYKVRFVAGSITSGYMEGVTSSARSMVTFMRMGDT